MISFGLGENVIERQSETQRSMGREAPRGPGLSKYQISMLSIVNI